jgi:hypothetical protein
VQSPIGPKGAGPRAYQTMLSWRRSRRQSLARRLPFGRPAPRVSQTELQQALQRFATQFEARITQAAQSLTEADANFREPALERALACCSSALDITVGPVPEINVLDMLVFVTLTRDVFEHHWEPLVFGEPGADFLQVLQSSAENLWRIAGQLLSEQQESVLRKLIEDWKGRHPDQIQVEGVRFAEFSALAGEGRRPDFASGLLADVRTATRAADSAVVLGERMMFLAPRIPFIVRMHLRAGAM